MLLLKPKNQILICSSEIRHWSKYTTLARPEKNNLPESTVVAECLSRLVPQLLWEHFHNFVLALVGTAVLAILSTAHAGLAYIGISAPGPAQFGSFVLALAGNSGEGPEAKVWIC